jgi:phosphoribosylanthranilate isomerase
LKVKICGITNLADALVAIEYGADALGFIFAKASPRFITKEQIKQIVSALPPFITTVGVFTEGTKEEVETSVSECGISLIQLHGRFSLEIIAAFSQKAIEVVSLQNLDSHIAGRVARARAILLDIGQNKIDPFDRGTLFDLPSFPNRNVILAGGLTPENVREAILNVKPYGVDVCSGVEMEKGKKDHEKMRRFILNAKGHA